jgi:hypothetical protein
VRARPSPVSPFRVERGEEAERRLGRGAKESTIKPRDEGAGSEGDDLRRGTARAGGAYAEEARSAAGAVAVSSVPW